MSWPIKKDELLKADKVFSGVIYCLCYILIIAGQATFRCVADSNDYKSRAFMVEAEANING